MLRDFITIGLASLMVAGVLGGWGCRNDRADGEAVESPAPKKTERPSATASPGLESDRNENGRASETLTSADATAGVIESSVGHDAETNGNGSEESVPDDSDEDGSLEALTETAEPAIAPVVPSDVAAAQRDVVSKLQVPMAFSADINTTYTRKTEREVETEGVGFREVLVRDGRIYHLTKTYTQIILAQEDGRKILTGQRLTHLYDGSDLYITDERHKFKRAFKSRPILTRMKPLGGSEIVRRMNKAGQVQLLPEATVEGRPVYVFDSTRKGGDVRTLLYIDKGTGLLLKSEVENRAEDSKATFALSNLNFAPNFEDDHFVFHPPDDVYVIDLTQPGSSEMPYPPITQ